MQGGAEHQNTTAAPHRGPGLANQTDTDQEYLHICQSALPADTWHSHGYPYDPLLRQPLYGKTIESRILAEAERKPDVWWRYINDVFTIWTHGESHLKEFLQQINQAHFTIKFTAEWSLDSVTFLDVRAILKDGSIQTDLYSKPTDIHQYLAMDSCHPRHCKQAIPYGQALTLRRICSEEEHLKQRTSELKQHLARRGYDPAEVQNQIYKAAEVSRVSALQPSQKRGQTGSPW